MKWWRLLLEKKNKKACLLIFSTSGVFIVSNIYSNSLFLSTYPGHWVAYLLFAQTIANSVIGFALSPLIIKNPKKNCLNLFVAFSIFVLIVYFFGPYYFNMLPFIVAVLMGIICLLSNLIGWVLISLAFNIQEFKKIGSYISAFSNLGFIIASLSTSLVTTEDIKYALLLILGFLILSYVYISKLDIIEKKSGKVKIEQSSPFKVPLYRNLFIYALVLYGALALVDYIFKSHLNIYYHKQEIAEFFGLFYFCTNTIGFCASLLLTNVLLRRLQVPGLFFLLPIGLLVGSVIIIFNPSLWTLTFLATISAVLYANYSSLARELTLNILPANIRLRGKFQIKNVATPLGSGIVLLFITIFNEQLDDWHLIILLMMLCLLILYYLLKVKKNYKKTLKEETEFRRFNIIEEVNSGNQVLFRTLATDALQSSNQGSFLLGLELARKTHLRQFPENFYNHLEDEDPLFREMLAKFIRKEKIVKAKFYLIKRFKKENNFRVSLALMEALIKIKLPSALKLAHNQYLTRNKDRSINQTAMIVSVCVLLRYGNADEQHHAKTVFNELLQSEDTTIRYVIVRLIGQLKLKEYASQIASYIYDANEKVAAAAILTASRLDLVELIPFIIDHIRSGPIANAGRKSLSRFGAKIIPILLERFPREKNKILLLQILGDIPGKEADRALIQITQEHTIYLRTHVAEIMTRRALHGLWSKINSDEIKILIKQEIAMYYYLSSLINLSLQDFIQREIQSRIKFCKKRLLQWISLLADPIVINKVLATLLEVQNQTSINIVYAKAIELLEIDVRDPALITDIEQIFVSSEEIANKPSQKIPFRDEWLETILKIT